MAKAIGTLVGIVILIVLFSFFVYFSGFIGLIAAAGALIGGGLLVALGSGSRVALRVFSSRGWLMPLGAFVLILALAPLIFEQNFCSAQLASGTASQLFNLPGETPGKIYSSSLEGECLADGGFIWAMRQPTGVVRIALLLGGLLLFLFALSGRRKPRPLPGRKVSQLTDFPPDIAARLRTPATPLPPSSDGTARPWTPEMVALVREAAALNGGSFDLELAERLAGQPAFYGVTTRGIVAKARTMGIEYQNAERVDT